MSQRVYDGVFDSLEHSVSHGSTFAPNDLAMAAGLATLAELDDARARRARRPGSASCCSSGRARSRTTHDVVREVRGLGLMWAMEFAEPESGSIAWRVMERMQSGCSRSSSSCRCSPSTAMLSQVAGHDLPVLKGLPPLVLSEQDVDDFADGARRRDRQGGPADARRRTRADAQPARARASVISACRSWMHWRAQISASADEPLAELLALAGSTGTFSGRDARRAPGGRRPRRPPRSRAAARRRSRPRPPPARAACRAPRARQSSRRGRRRRRS